jgi:hypothetical protein
LLYSAGSGGGGGRSSRAPVKDKGFTLHISYLSAIIADKTGNIPIR